MNTSDDTLQKLIADLNNKLSPLWTLSELVKEYCGKNGGTSDLYHLLSEAYPISEESKPRIKDIISKIALCENQYDWIQITNQTRILVDELYEWYMGGSIIVLGRYKESEGKYWIYDESHEDGDITWSINDFTHCRKINFPK